MKKIVKFLDVIYYNLYLFFKKTGEIEESAALFAMVFCFEFMISGILLSVCEILNVNLKSNILYIVFVLVLIIWFLLELRYLRKDKYMSIVRKKPIIKSKKVSKIITIVFIILSLIPLFVLLPIVSSFRQIPSESNEYLWYDFYKTYQP